MLVSNAKPKLDWGNRTRHPCAVYQSFMSRTAITLAAITCRFYHLTLNFVWAGIAWFISPPARLMQLLQFIMKLNKVVETPRPCLRNLYPFVENYAAVAEKSQCCGGRVDFWVCKVSVLVRVLWRQLRLLKWVVCLFFSGLMLSVAVEGNKLFVPPTPCRGDRLRDSVIFMEV
jgi:hypothetical protein